MTPAQAWRTLGIASTGETRPIRQAYANKLRALDVDADPDAFSALREARDLALQLAERGAVASDAEDAAAIAEPLPDTWRVAAETLRTPLLVQPDIDGDVRVPPPEPRLDFHGEPAVKHARAPAIAPIVPIDVSLRPPVLDVATDGTVSAGSDKDKFDLHYRAIHQLLLPEGVEEPQRLTQDELVVLRAHVDAVLRDPRLEEVAFYGDVATWFANTIARSCPRSDPLLATVINQFGWMAGADKVGQDPAISFLVRRQRSFEFLHDVQQPRHKYNSAWRELTRPSNERSRKSWGVSKSKVKELLATIRRDYPDLEDRLDWHRVNLWENRYTFAKTAFPVGILLIVAFRLLVAFGNFTASPPTPEPIRVSDFEPAPLSAAIPDIDGVLKAMYGDALDAGRLSLANPALDQDLNQLWKAANEKHEDRADFQRDVAKLLNEHVNRGIRRADYALIAEYRRFELDEALVLERESVIQCANFFSGRSWTFSMTTSYDEAAFKQRGRALSARILLDTDTSVSKRPVAATFKVPPEIFADTIKRSGLTRKEMDNALNFGGSAEQQCKARIALSQAALAAPQGSGFKLLRFL